MYICEDGQCASLTKHLVSNVCKFEVGTVYNLVCNKCFTSTKSGIVVHLALVL